MKTRRIPIVFFSLFLSLMMLVSCGSSSKSEPPADSTNTGQATQDTKLKIGMVTDSGGIGDKSFNDSTYAGLKRAQEDFGIDLQVLEPKQDSDFEPYLEKISQTSDLVVSVGYKLKDATQTIASRNPDVNYVLIDDEAQGNNIYNLTFKEEEASFLAGVLAGLTTKTNKVGFIGGTDSPLIRKFEAGFTAGVKSVNPEAGKLLEDGITSRYAGTFTDVSKGYEIAKSLYDDGVDIIYHAAGAVGIGMFRAAKETGKYAIGVDQDQALSLPEYADVILTSVVKNLDKGIYKIVQDTLDSGFKSGTISIGLKDDGVSLASTMNEVVTQETLDKVEEYKQKIISGEIVVPKTIDELKNFNN